MLSITLQKKRTLGKSVCFSLQRGYSSLSVVLNQSCIEVLNTVCRLEENQKCLDLHVSLDSATWMRHDSLCTTVQGLSLSVLNTQFQ